MPHDLTSSIKLLKETLLVDPLAKSGR